MSEIAHPVHFIETIQMTRVFRPPYDGYIWLQLATGKRLTRDYVSTDREFNRDVGKVAESFKAKNRSMELVAIVKSASSKKFERLEIRPKKRNPK